MDWLSRGPVVWAVLIIFAVTYLVTAAIVIGVRALSRDERGERAVSAVSPGMLPPLGILFGLLIGFLIAQVATDHHDAQITVNQEANALADIDLLSAQFPGPVETEMRALVRRQVSDIVNVEFPDMADQHLSLAVLPTPLVRAQALAFSIQPKDDGQKLARQSMVGSIQTAMTARRQRLIAAQSSIDWVKWAGLILEGLVTLVAVACVHRANPTTMVVATAVFATAIAAALALAAIENLPFAGEIAIHPGIYQHILVSGA